MILYPAIDLRGGRAVQLVGGEPGNQRVSLPDPQAVARQWIDAGFHALHVVDLDAALGSGDNRAIIRDILETSSVPVQVGGGVRDDAALDALFEAGAARVIVGTRAVEEPSWRAAAAARYPDRIVVAADVRGDTIVTRGWVEQSTLRAESFLAALAGEPLAAVLVTDVGREGRLGGVDVAKFTRMVAAAAHPLIAAGGIRDLDDVRALASIRVAGAVLGMALYTGTVNAEAAVAEFGAAADRNPAGAA